MPCTVTSIIRDEFYEVSGSGKIYF